MQKYSKGLKVAPKVAMFLHKSKGFIFCGPLTVGHFRLMLALIKHQGKNQEISMLLHCNNLAVNGVTERDSLSAYEVAVIPFL